MSVHGPLASMRDSAKTRAVAWRTDHMVRSRIALVSALSAMLYINGLQAADVSMDNEKSLSDSGEWSEQSLAKGKNEAHRQGLCRNPATEPA